MKCDDPMRSVARIGHGIIAAFLTFIAERLWLESEVGEDLWPAFVPAAAFWTIGAVSLLLSLQRETMSAPARKGKRGAPTATGPRDSAFAPFL